MEHYLEIWKLMSINIIGSGLAGLSAAITLAKQNIACNLISALPSERAQSVLAEGGINGALNTMGEDDCPADHMADTLKAGAYIADPEAVKGLTDNAPEILRWLMDLGVPFNMECGRVIQRNFGGQKKKRTAFAKSSTGKILMSVLTDETRKYEAAGLIKRYDHHEFEMPEFTGAEGSRVCRGAWVRDDYSNEMLFFEGPVIMCTGGMNGFFPGMTTGTVPNTGDASAMLFSQGVFFSNLEMIQFHPTTYGIAGKRCLVSEAARGEGGRLFVMKGGKPWFFMEEKYPELGNLMPRDVVAREMYFVMHDEALKVQADGGAGTGGTKQGKIGNDAGSYAGAGGARQGKSRKNADPYAGCRPGQVYLEMRHLPSKTWEEKLPDLREELIHYLNVDPKKAPVPVEPGIHYFMGGIDVDIDHRTNIAGLYAAGECCSQYHGANRLGGNSTMGAIYGGRVAAETAAEEAEKNPAMAGVRKTAQPQAAACRKGPASALIPADPEFIEELSNILLDAMGIVRNHAKLQGALEKIENIKNKRGLSVREKNRLCIAEAMLLCADRRKESRGAHYREDFPQTDDAYKGKITAVYDAESGQVKTGFKAV